MEPTTKFDTERPPVGPDTLPCDPPSDMEFGEFDLHSEEYERVDFDELFQD